MTQTAYTNPNSGLHSIVEASEDYELAPIGIASLKDQADRLAEFGRNGDIYVVHAAEGETVIPMEVLDANPHIKSLLFNQMEEMGLDPNRYIVGNEFNSRNPVTGMPEFFGFIKKIFKKIKKAVKKVFKVVKKIAPVAIPLAASFFGIPFLSGIHGTFMAGGMGAAALGSGIGTLVGGGSLKDALKSAAIGGGLAGLTGGLKGFMQAPPGQGWVGAKQGVMSTLTGQTPIYNAAGQLVGQQAAATPGQMWDAVMGGDFTGALKGDIGTTTYTPEYLASPEGALYGPDWQSGLITSPEFATPGELPVGATRYAPTLQTSSVPSVASVPAVLPNSSLAPGTAPGDLRSTLGVSGAPITVSGNLSGNLSGTTAVADAAKGPLLASFSPSQFIADHTGLLEKGSNLADLGIVGGATYLTGGFDPAEEEDRRETADAARDALAPLVIDEDAVRLAQINVDAPAPTTTAEELLQPTLFSATGGSVEYPRRDLLVEGPGTEKSDDIPAMLSDGEFVINSKAVRGADPSGRGDRYAGANNLYNLMRNFEMRA
jgi:hypothetical protein|tara:strand:- start:1376 stop:3007 length:1632 start_codon:yes stop_codon:yes gene_type:complete